jgi:hypothetical protein
MEAEETTALDFYLDRLKTDIAESPGRVFDVATNVVAAVPGLLGDAQRVLNPKTGAPEGVRKLPTSSDIAEDMGASGEGYGAILGQLLSPLSPADFKLALGAGGALLGYMGVAGQGRKLPRALEAMRGGPAYHGTPHKFDQFDLEKIGTGEGAQAYGHGLYFAEDASVAGHYQNKLSNGPAIITLNGERKFVSDMPLTSEGDALYAYERAEGDIAAARKLVFSDARRWLDANADDLKFLGREKGHLYEVDIPDETIAKMLDWDAPLSEQPENVRRYVKRERLGLSDDATGEDIYKTIAAKYGDDIETDPKGYVGGSMQLSAEGIAGIRYYDGSSRAKGEGTRNIVVFNPDDIKQVKRDGELVYKTGLLGDNALAKPTTSGVEKTIIREMTEPSGAYGGDYLPENIGKFYPEGDFTIVRYDGSSLRTADSTEWLVFDKNGKYVNHPEFKRLKDAKEWGAQNIAKPTTGLLGDNALAKPTTSGE